MNENARNTAAQVPVTVTILPKKRTRERPDREAEDAEDRRIAGEHQRTQRTGG